MKKKMIVVSLAALMVLVMASVSFAATETSEGRQFFRGFGRQGGFQFIMDKLGLTEEEALDLKNRDKTMMEIAAEKGLDIEQWHEEMLETRNQRIDDLVEAGKITAEEAEEFKALMAERFENCFEGEGFGLGRGMMGRGLGKRMMGRGLKGWQQ